MIQQGLRAAARFSILSAAGVMMAGGVALAQTAADTAAKPDSTVADFLGRTEVSGSVDMYYGYNFNTPHTECGAVGEVAVFNCLRSFDVAHNAFSMSLAQVAFAKKPTTDNRGGFRVDLGYGPSATLLTAAESDASAVYQNVQQAYLSYLMPVGNGLQVDFGKFFTPTGIETLRSQDNWNYSRSLLFTLATPRYGVGMRASYPLTDKVSVDGFLINGVNRSADNNGGKTIGGQLTVKPMPNVRLSAAYRGGPEQDENNSNWRHTTNLSMSIAPTKQMSVAIDYDYGQDTERGSTVSWKGVAGYVRFQPADWFAVTPRVEYFSDTNGYTTGEAQTLKEATLTLEFKHRDGVMLRVEYRGDFSDQLYFVKNLGEDKNQSTLTFGLVYAFGPKGR